METPTPRGRPRSETAHRAILEAALKELAKTGFRDLTMAAIAKRAATGKATIYRRWPNKAAVVMDAFLLLVGPGIGFPKALTAMESLRLQMRRQAKFFRSPSGRAIKALLGEAQFDKELSEAFRDRWIEPRRELTRGILARAIHEGDLRQDIDFEDVIDMLYAPLYYRLQIETGTLDNAYSDRIFEHVRRAMSPP